jgi:uncharacterized protein (DUF1778 family)
MVIKQKRVFIVSSELPARWKMLLDFALIDHPTEPNEKINLMFDIPHIFKCSKNNMMKVKKF